MKKGIAILISAILIVLGCVEPSKIDHATQGTVQVVADETLFPVIDALESAFEHTYPDANVTITYLPEAAAFNSFLNDSNNVIVSARRLDALEEGYLSGNALNPRTAIIADDAVAILMNHANVDTNLTCNQVIGLLKGAITEWNQIDATNECGSINLVFDNQGSSMVTFAKKMANVDTLPVNSYAMKTTEAVVDYVARHKGAIGIVGYSWLSDYDDPTCKALLAKISIAAISPCGNGQQDKFYKPFASNVENQFYPFSRQVFIINRETNVGLGTGFSAFIAGELGQRIISKTGILPAYKVERNIELRSEPFQVKK